MKIATKTIERLRDALLKSGRRTGTVTSSAYRTLFREGLLSNEEKEALARVAPVAETMFLVMAADEQITDTELAALRGAVRGLAGNVLSDDVVQLMMESYAGKLRDEGRVARLTAIAASTTDRDEALNAFSLAAAVALADGQVVESESSVIDELRSYFQLSDADVANVLGELADDDE
jgi:tellurite resistance protein